jgi:predicted NBD/HSP70 family sugar kinase
MAVVSNGKLCQVRGRDRHHVGHITVSLPGGPVAGCTKIVKKRFSDFGCLRRGTSSKQATNQNTR